MATLKQKKLARAIVDNLTAPETKTAQQILENVGYSTNTADSNSGLIMEQKGVVEELELLGFTVDKAKNVVASIMNNASEESNVRLKAADITFKVHGAYAPVKQEISGELKTTNLPPNKIDQINEIALDD